MALKSSSHEPEKGEVIEEALDVLDKQLERLRTLYEQYFLGIQKQAPAYIHTDVERKIRDLTQLQIRNTALRYRFNTLQQKFGSYNAYWRRTLRQIENGTYTRNLSKIGRKAAQRGEEIPEEILAAMPKRMREQVLRDREVALAQAKRRGQLDDDFATEESTDEDIQLAPAAEPTLKRTDTGALVLEDLDDVDLDAFLAQATAEAEAAPSPSPAVHPRGVTTALPRLPTDPAGTGSLPVQAGGTGGFPRAATRPPTKPPPTVPTTAPPAPIPRAATNPARPGTLPTVPTSASGGFPRVPTTAPSEPAVHPRGVTTALPIQRAAPPPIPTRASTSTQAVRPNPVQPGAAERHATPAPPTVGGRAPARPDRDTFVGPSPTPAAKPPPGMTDADVESLYSKYVKAKQMVGEQTGPQTREKLLRTIHAQAPKIMEQYKAKAVDFSIVVKDNQVIIKAKPKT